MSLETAAAPSITAFWAGCHGLLGLYLALRVVVLRRKTLILYNAEGKDGVNDLLLAVSRGHGNFSEFAPLGLLLIGLAEATRRAPPPLLHILGASLLAGRVLYSIATSRPIGEIVKARLVWTRVLGMALTFAAHAGIAVSLLGFPGATTGGYITWALFVGMGVLTMVRGNPRRRKPNQE